MTSYQEVLAAETDATRDATAEEMNHFNWVENYSTAWPSPQCLDFLMCVYLVPVHLSDNISLRCSQTRQGFVLKPSAKA